MICPRKLAGRVLCLATTVVLVFSALVQPVDAGAQEAQEAAPAAHEAQPARPQAIQGFEAPAARHVPGRRGLAPIYHPALLPFLEHRVAYATVELNSALIEDDPEVGEYGHHGVGARLGMATPVGSRYGVGLDAITEFQAHDVESGIFDPLTAAISGSVGVHLLRGWAVGVSLGVFASTADTEVIGPGLEDSEEYFDEVTTGLYWSAGFGWSSAERNVSFGWRIVNPRYEDGLAGDTPRSFIAYPDEESDGQEVFLEEIPTPWATEGYFRVAFLENRLSFVLVSRREYHLGPDFGRARDFAFLERNIMAEYVFSNRVAARIGYNRRDENYQERFSTSGQGVLAGASFLVFNTIWDINLSYKQALRTTAPWSAETIPEFGVGLSLVRNW